MDKTLIAYFSASGSTAKLANTLAQATGGDLYEIRPAVPYTSADLNWNNKSSRSSVEMNDKAARPAIIQTFLESSDFSGKTVIPFATSGGSGLGKTASILQKSCPAAHVLPGKRMSASADIQELSTWVKSLGV